MQGNELIEVDTNVRLHIRDWGQGKTIVFIPGWPLSLEMYEYQFTQLPKHGYRCVGITLRGFGKSSKPWGEYTYDVFADDVRKVLRRLTCATSHWPVFQWVVLLPCITWPATRGREYQNWLSLVRQHRASSKDMVSNTAWSQQPLMVL
ncbi:MAG: alpha/beta hydrolase [Candidatus Kuenenia stuttgartiensis]|nr:alpha/beta hydrolase [Candidatus Kuenenia stuttgartiensis]